MGWFPNGGDCVWRALTVRQLSRNTIDLKLVKIDMTPADKLRNVQDTDDDIEQDLWEGGYSGKSMVGSWIGAGLITAGVVAALIMIEMLRNNTYAFYAALIVVAAMWLYLFGLLAYRKLGIEYQVTNQQLKHRSGILFRKIDRIELIDIDDVNYRQGPIQSIMRVGNICIRSSDTSHPELVMQGIANVSDVADLINDARRQERRKRGLHIEAI
jgi:membrane protein YdbS with pleckstrin-like domain